MTLKSNADQQSVLNFPRRGPRFAGRSTAAVSTLRRVITCPGNFVAEAIVIPKIIDVNVNLDTLHGDMPLSASDLTVGEVTFVPSSWSRPSAVEAASLVSALDDEDEEDEDEDDDYEDDELDEDDDEEGEDEDFEDDLDEDEDEDLEDDDLEDDDEGEDEEDE